MESEAPKQTPPTFTVEVTEGGSRTLPAPDTQTETDQETDHAG